MGGSSRSATSSDQISNLDEDNFNLQDVNADSIIVASGDVSTGDFGAIDAAREIALESLDFAGDSFQRAIEQSGATAAQAVEKGLNIAAEASQDTAAKSMKNFLIAGTVVAVAAIAFKRGRA